MLMLAFAHGLRSLVAARFINRLGARRVSLLSPRTPCHGPVEPEKGKLAYCRWVPWFGTVALVTVFPKLGTFIRQNSAWQSTFPLALSVLA